MAFATTVIGRGKLWIAEWTGDDYVTPPEEGGYEEVGNCKDIVINAKIEEKEHQDYQAGMKVIDDVVSFFAEYTGSFTTDNITKKNLMRWLMGTETANAVRLLTALSKKYALRLVEANAKGPNTTWNFWRCQVKPDGDLKLISDDFRELKFTFRTLKDDTNHPDEPFGTQTYTTTTTTTSTTTTTTTTTT